ncbi:restriction endonuclease [Rubrivivax albus]|uniref:Restriction endonuclease n=1 Tax=Rubrivivax albus TaxID=2499835 RepID=A0A3S2TJ43_9BURK|nr:restriction endonuclease [Rubrivivax albus]RVT48012.1 restriction endonuclease [Rubrivivax albus]
MASAWQNYQEQAASFFRSLGMDAQTDVTVQGARTKHDIDVLVKSRHVGFEVTWIVECKCWQTPVNKLHVLALREIVSDTGADRGILLSESCFQIGAKEAAALTNVHLQSLAESEAAAGAEVIAMRLAELNDRVQRCRVIYWELPKSLRIQYGLRPYGGEFGYLGDAVIKLAESTILKAFRGAYPFEADYMSRAAASWDFPEELTSPEHVVTHLEPLIAELEGKLEACVAALPADHPLQLGAGKGAVASTSSIHVS